MVVAGAVLCRRLRPNQRELSRKIVHIGTGAVVPLAWFFEIPFVVALPVAAVITVVTTINHQWRFIPAVEDVDRNMLRSTSSTAGMKRHWWLIVVTTVITAATGRATTKGISKNQAKGTTAPVPMCTIFLLSSLWFGRSRRHNTAPATTIAIQVRMAMGPVMESKWLRRLVGGWSWRAA